jgi:hypothetical protein
MTVFIFDVYFLIYPRVFATLDYRRAALDSPFLMQKVARGLSLERLGRFKVG